MPQALAASATQSARSVAALPSSQALIEQTNDDLRSVRQAKAQAEQELRDATQALSPLGQHW
jgi:hypothetical protein